MEGGAPQDGRAAEEREAPAIGQGAVSRPGAQRPGPGLHRRDTARRAMTGLEHFAEAERIVLGERCDYGCPHGGCAHEMAYLARAQVHALLALTAATALPGQHPGDWEREIWSFGPET